MQAKVNGDDLRTERTIEDQGSPPSWQAEGKKVYCDNTSTLDETSVAPLGGPAELRLAKAIANIAIARIEPRTAFVLSHLSNSRGFLR
jgi:hypothetical protein